MASAGVAATDATGHGVASVVVTVVVLPLAEALVTVHVLVDIFVRSRSIDQGNGKNAFLRIL